MCTHSYLHLCAPSLAHKHEIGSIPTGVTWTSVVLQRVLFSITIVITKLEIIFFETGFSGCFSHASSSVLSLYCASKRLEVICVFFPLLSFVHSPVRVGRVWYKAWFTGYNVGTPCSFIYLNHRTELLGIFFPSQELKSINFSTFSLLTCSYQWNKLCQKIRLSKKPLWGKSEAFCNIF